MVWIVDKTQELRDRINLKTIKSYHATLGNSAIGFVLDNDYDNILWYYKTKKARDKALAEIDKLLDVKNINNK